MSRYFSIHQWKLLSRHVEEAREENGLKYLQGMRVVLEQLGENSDIVLMLNKVNRSIKEIVSG